MALHLLGMRRAWGVVGGIHYKKSPTKDLLDVIMDVMPGPGMEGRQRSRARPMRGGPLRQAEGG